MSEHERIVRETRETPIRVELTRGTAARSGSPATPVPRSHAGHARALRRPRPRGRRATGDLSHHLDRGRRDHARRARSRELIPPSVRPLRRAHRADGRRAGAGGARRRRRAFIPRARCPSALLRALDALVRRAPRARRCTCACMRGTRPPPRRRGGVQGARSRAARRAGGRGDARLQHQGRGRAVGRVGYRRRAAQSADSQDAEEADRRFSEAHRLPRRRRRVASSRACGSKACATWAIRPSSPRATRRRARTRSSFSTSPPSAEERQTVLEVARRTAEVLFIPLTLGGGIGSVEGAERGAAR